LTAVDKPSLLLIGGCNGAGKSTLARKLLPEYGIIRFLNADDIARGLSPFDSNAAALSAGRLLLKEARGLIAAGTSFALESTLSGRGHAALLMDAKKAGFNIVLHHVLIESEAQAIGRVRLRVSLGGHHVPVADIERRFKRGRQLMLDLYLPLADEWSVWNNSFPPPREIANSNNCSPERLSDMLESSNLMETDETAQPDIVRKGLKAGREATEEMLEYYRRMGVKVTPEMTLADENEVVKVPRGVL
jgi:predicted ABC-type ATPase